MFRSEREGGGIYVVSALGGDERMIAEGGRVASFSPDGKLVAYWVGSASTEPFVPGTSRICVSSGSGDETRQLQPGFEQAGATSALVMELGEGEDLAQRIGRARVLRPLTWPYGRGDFAGMARMPGGSGLRAHESTGRQSP